MLFVYKTYKTTFQRLIIYYVALSLWLDVSAVLLIVGAFTDTDGEWICNIQEYLLIGSQFAWYTYIIIIANFSLFLTVYLTRLRRERPLSKQSSRFWECVCIISPVAIGLTVASAMQIYGHANGIGCTVTGQNLQLTESWGVSLSLFLEIDLEVILVSISLCIYFYFIRQRIQNGQTTVLLRNSVIHVAINASITGLDTFCAGYNVYVWSTIDSSKYLDLTVTNVFIAWNVVFMLAIGVAVITQSVLCIQTSSVSERHRGCCKASRDSELQHVIIGGKDTCAATNPASSHVSQPSYTNFAIPYTGGFTQITATIKENEQRRLIECTYAE